MKTILAIDDSAIIRELIRYVLTDAGFEVVGAVDGQEGLDRLADLQPDIILTDINMPRLNGFEFIQQARQIERCRGVPILVLSSESDGDKKARAREAGATGWIVKPFNPQQLVSALQRVAA